MQRLQRVSRNSFSPCQIGSVVYPNDVAALYGLCPLTTSPSPREGTEAENPFSRFVQIVALLISGRAQSPTLKMNPKFT